MPVKPSVPGLFFVESFLFFITNSVSCYKFIHVFNFFLSQFWCLHFSRDLSNLCTLFIGLQLFTALLYTPLYFGIVGSNVSFSFLTLVNLSVHTPLLISAAQVLSILLIFSKKQILALLSFFIVFLFFISFIFRSSLFFPSFCLHQVSFALPFLVCSGGRSGYSFELFLLF